MIEGPKTGSSESATGCAQVAADLNLAGITAFKLIYLQLALRASTLAD